LQWFKQLLKVPNIPLNCPSISKEDNALLDSIVANFNPEDAQKVKEIEKITNHDVKAVEYFLKEKFKASPVLSSLAEYIHFTCTSEDINNLAYGLSLHHGLHEIYLPKVQELLNTLLKMAKEMSAAAMMSRTHGQLATPTTMGKEIANYAFRINNYVKVLKEFKVYGKFNGAVGNFNAHLCACPNVDWLDVSKNFVESLNLTWNPYSTQIEQHDSMANLFNTIERLNTVLIGFCRDIWMYVSYGLLMQKVVKGEVGSSTMPHKVNPISFENAEGNLGLSNSLFSHFANKLPISRMQRDLSDSTVLRNVGSAFAYSIVSYGSILSGLRRITINKEDCIKELDSHYELLAEAVQTVMRRYKKAAPYEVLKEFTRGRKVNREAYVAFVSKLDLPTDEIEKLKELKPSGYLELAKELAKKIEKYL
jgi:adenylosuccinate lyase